MMVVFVEKKQGGIRGRANLRTNTDCPIELLRK